MTPAQVGTTPGMETNDNPWYPDRTGESVEAAGVDIVSLDEITDEQDGLAVEQDGIDSLRDIEAEANDEHGLRDLSIVDVRENREIGLKLDSTGQPEPYLD
jgi:hypothetical protein